MRPLIITEETIQKINQLVDWVDNHPYSMDDLFDIMNGSLLPPGDNERFRIYIDVGYKVVYTVEEQKFKVKHMSISVDGDKPDLPSPEATEEIMKLFGYKGLLCDCLVTFEKISPIKEAVNIYEYY